MKYTKRILVSFTVEEYEMIKNAAEKDDRTAGGWCRIKILKYFRIAAEREILDSGLLKEQFPSKEQ